MSCQVIMVKSFIKENVTMWLLNNLGIAVGGVFHTETICG